MTRRKSDVLKDIKKSILLIEDYLEDVSKKEFFRNQEKQDAVINRLLIIGEAAKLVSQEIKEKYQDIPWKNMAGMRDVMIHRYHGIDLEIVWETVNKELKELAREINSIIDELENKK